MPTAAGAVPVALRRRGRVVGVGVLVVAGVEADRDLGQEAGVLAALGGGVGGADFGGVEHLGHLGGDGAGGFGDLGGPAVKRVRQVPSTGLLEVVVHPHRGGGRAGTGEEDAAGGAPGIRMITRSWPRSPQ